MKKVGHTRRYHVFLVLQRETPDFRLLTRAQRGNFIPLLASKCGLGRATVFEIAYERFKESALWKENVVF
jgi:hypothetical protein